MERNLVWSRSPSGAILRSPRRKRRGVWDLPPLRCRYSANDWRWCCFQARKQCVRTLVLRRFEYLSSYKRPVPGPWWLICPRPVDLDVVENIVAGSAVFRFASPAPVWTRGCSTTHNSSSVSGTVGVERFSLTPKVGGYSANLYGSFHLKEIAAPDQFVCWNPAQ